MKNFFKGFFKGVIAIFAAYGAWDLYLEWKSGKKEEKKNILTTDNYLSKNIDVDNLATDEIQKNTNFVDNSKQKSRKDFVR